MTNELQPLKRITPELSYNNIDDVYVYIPFRKKNSVDYRNLVKSFGSQFDPIELRWYVTSDKITEKTKYHINTLNLYDGLRYKIRDDNPFSDKFTFLYEKCDVLHNYVNCVTISKQINFDRRLAVQYFTFTNLDYILEIFIDRFYDVDYNALSAEIIRRKILKMNFLPRVYARANWKHYASHTNNVNIVDIDVSGLQKICDSFI